VGHPFATNRSFFGSDSSARVWKQAAWHRPLFRDDKDNLSSLQAAAVIIDGARMVLSLIKVLDHAFERLALGCFPMSQQATFVVLVQELGFVSKSR
jgi:hypothetical protein